MSVREHKAHARPAADVRLAIVTVSDTRTSETDVGGNLTAELCRAAGYSVVSQTIVRDEPDQVTSRVKAWAAAGEVDAVLLTGGTGLSRRDTTVEAVSRLFEKTLPGYGELFRALSFAEVGAAAMLSRANAGTVGRAVVFTMPGSPAGVRLALEKLILPELAHVVSQLQGGQHGPG